MEYEVGFLPTDDVWRVEGIDIDSGDIEQVLFSGPRAEKRARDYAAWMSAKAALCGECVTLGPIQPDEIGASSSGCFRCGAKV